MARLTIKVISSSGTKHDLRVFDKDTVYIGRGYDNDVVLGDPYISAKHASVRISDDGNLIVKDLGSRNGIFIASKIGRIGTVDCATVCRVCPPLR